jgi:hypothetical protein
MKRFVAAAFALIGLALTTGALAAPPVSGRAADAAEDRSGVVQGGKIDHGPEDVTFHPPVCASGHYHCEGTATTLSCECDEDEEV